MISFPPTKVQRSVDVHPATAHPSSNRHILDQLYIHIFPYRIVLVNQIKFQSTIFSTYYIIVNSVLKASRERHLDVDRVLDSTARCAELREAPASGECISKRLGGFGMESNISHHRNERPGLFPFRRCLSPLRLPKTKLHSISWGTSLCFLLI